MIRELFLSVSMLAASAAIAAPKAPEVLGTTVQWKMSLDSQGHVAALSPKSGTMDAIRVKLEPVVRDWEFIPGTINGEPAATETMLSVQISLLPLPNGESFAIRFDDVRTGGYVGKNSKPPRFSRSAAQTVLRDGGFARLVFEVSYDKAGTAQAVVVQPGSTEIGGRLIGDAEKALREWVYEPKRVAGVGVPGKLIVPICYTVGFSRREAEKAGKSCLWALPGSKATVGEGESLALDSIVTMKSDVINKTLSPGS